MLATRPLQIELTDLAYEVLLSHSFDLRENETILLLPSEEAMLVTEFENGDASFFVPLKYRDVTIYVPFSEYEEMTGKVIYLDFNDVEFTMDVDSVK